MAKKVVCKHCGSVELIKKGCSATARMFLCKSCGRRFQYSAEDLDGTPYEIKGTAGVASSKSTATPKVNKEAIKTRKTTTIKDTTTCASGRITERVITPDNVDEAIRCAKRDKKGQFYLRTANGIPSPFGSTAEDLKRILANNGYCQIVLDSEGIFVMKAKTQTKG